MFEKQITIINKLGLHARAAAKLINVTSSFSSDIQLTKDGRQVDGKSIMSVMMLAASKGTELTISATGDDEQQALNAIELLINNRFDEEE
ncbi:MAG: HPr family phosphocarrier protein [Amphritea sp.]|jgi:phosphocarrier protein|uniref:HPr family phosphocarrier protein n=1 Tax=Amphritea sp. TaxID=1872502 RepID=UPI001B5C82DE|nr:HPr family phosphocarrier protein [Amphritea sp.]MBQ0757675.1 HPr family phosphocarrier protein [Amphritea sp.]MBQ0784701.1 HPr family phosphocarrier protein [Amphritea sp.]